MSVFPIQISSDSAVNILSVFFLVQKLLFIHLCSLFVPVFFPFKYFWLFASFKYCTTFPNKCCQVSRLKYFPLFPIKCCQFFLLIYFPCFPFKCCLFSPFRYFPLSPSNVFGFANWLRIWLPPIVPGTRLSITQLSTQSKNIQLHVAKYSSLEITR